MNILKTSRESWKRAQEWERQHWLEGEFEKLRFGKNFIYGILSRLRLKPVYRGDDYNHWWKSQFEDYGFLPKAAHNVIELGCGPYTNLRLMLDKCEMKHIFLKDPLIETYASFKRTLISDMRRGRRFFVLDDHPLEECPFASDYFDIVVMINVLDHVEDADICIEKAMDITRKGGLLLLGQDLTDTHDLELLKGNIGEVGHPIKMGHDWLDQMLGDKFSPVIKKLLPRQEGRTDLHYGTYIFAGTKR